MDKNDKVVPNSGKKEDIKAEKQESKIVMSLKKLGDFGKIIIFLSLVILFLIVVGDPRARLPWFYPEYQVLVKIIGIILMIFIAWLGYKAYG